MITVTFWCGLMRTSDDMNNEPLANIVLWHVTLFRLYHGQYRNVLGKKFRLKLIRRCLLSEYVLFTSHSFSLPYRIMPCESSGCFCATRYNRMTVMTIAVALN